MPGKSKPAKGASKPLRSGPKYTDQSDMIYDFDLKRTVGNIGDWMILAFLAWSYVVVGAVLGQYVADMFLYMWFTMVMIAINIALATVFCSPLLWNQYVKMNMRKTMDKIAIVGAVFGAVLVVTWGCAILTWTYQDWSVAGQMSIPLPFMTAAWQEGLYWTGLVVTGLLWCVVECMWWNIGYDGISGASMPMRAWAGLCFGIYCAMLTDPMFQGEWSWMYYLQAFINGFIVNTASFFVTDFCGLGGAIALRLGTYVAHILLMAHVRWQWWGLSVFRHQFSWTPGNLFNLSMQTPPSI